MRKLKKNVKKIFEIWGIFTPFLSKLAADLIGGLPIIIGRLIGAVFDRLIGRLIGIGRTLLYGNALILCQFQHL